MSYLSIDFETGSQADLKKVGAAKYAEDPTTRIICVAYTTPWNMSDPKAIERDYVPPTFKWVPPEALVAWVRDGKPVRAWNAMFEYWIWHYHVTDTNRNVPSLKLDQLRDTMAQAAYWGLPLSLDMAGQALPELGIVKDKAGHALMKRMSRPRGQEVTGEFRWWDDEDPFKRKDLMDYCEQDVRTEMAIADYLPPLPPREQEIWLMDARANARGMQLDVTLAKRMKEIATFEQKRLDKDLSDETGGLVTGTNKAKALADWCVAQGLPEAADGLAKDRLPMLISKADEAGLFAVANALAIRQEAAKSSVAKLDAMLNYAGHRDSRMRGLTQYYGAFRTGRWAGRGPQVQNFPRSEVKDQEALVNVLRTRREDWTIWDSRAFEAVFGVSPLTGVSSALRGCIWVPEEDGYFASLDFSQIEARVLAWLAGSDKILDAYRLGKDLYVLAASGIYKVPEAQVDPDQRQVGKVCLAEDTLVLTKDPQGTIALIPISQVTVSHLVFDGVDWVGQHGPVYNGEKECVELNGACMTPDHMVWCGPSQGWKAAETVVSNADLNHQALGTASGSLWLLATLSDRKTDFEMLWSRATAALQNMKSRSLTCAGGVQADAMLAPRARAATPGKRNICNTRGPARTLPTDDACLTGSARSTPVATPPATSNSGTTVAGASSAGGRSSAGTNAWGPHPEAESCGRCVGVSRCSRISLLCRVGTTRIWNWIASIIKDGTRPGTFGLSTAKQTSKTERTPRNSTPASQNSKRKLPVYDLVNAGPRRRFTIWTDNGPLIVHNCVLALGYQGGVGAFQTMAKVYGLTIPDELAEDIKTKWREANPEIVSYWWDIQKAALEAVKDRGRMVEVRRGDVRIMFSSWRGHLVCRLPSGRDLIYREAEVGQGTYGDELTYMGIDQYTRQWKRISTYGGKLVENITQAVARDCMADALLALDKYRGVQVLGSVHDEALLRCYANTGEVLKYFGDVMANASPWAKGLPLDADGYIGRRFRK